MRGLLNRRVLCAGAGHEIASYRVRCAQLEAELNVMNQQRSEGLDRQAGGEEGERVADEVAACKVSRPHVFGTWSRACACLDGTASPVFSRIVESG